MKTELSTERRILDAAIQCIEMVGIQAATIRKIAQIAGVNSAAINYYFRSKDALLDRVLAATTENAFGDWERLIEDPTIPVVDRLRSILLEALEGTQQFPNLVKAHLHGPIMNSDYETVFAKRFRAFMVRARDALTQALPGNLDNLENRLVALFSATFGMGLLRGLFSEYTGADLGRPESRAVYLELLLRHFLGGES